MADPVRSDLMSGRRGIIMGVANDHSIAWGIARTLAAHGAELAFTYQGEAQGKRVRPLAETLGSDLAVPCDVGSDSEIDEAFGAITSRWGRIDFLVHAIAYSDRNELKGRYVETSRANFISTLNISCCSFTAVARRCRPLMSNGGVMLTLTFGGASRVMANYNVMGLAKAALEASVRYLAADLGKDGIRVNAISAGPMRTLAGSGVGDARMVYKWNKSHSPLKKTVDLNHVGGAALYLLSDLAGGVTGEVHFVDAGFNVIGMPPTADLKGWTPLENGHENGHSQEHPDGRDN